MNDGHTSEAGTATSHDRVGSPFPPGHFYSPIVNPDELRSRESELWPTEPTAGGIDFNDESHLRVLTEDFERFMPLYDYPERLPETEELTSFFSQNSQYSWLDARVLFVLMQSRPPRRVIEIGSGFSSLLMADVNRRWYDSSIDITCIEPYPRPFLKRGVPGITRMIECKVQEVAPDTFDVLEAGDYLFVDSSHVVKTGSDVLSYFFNVLPRLAPGVVVHIHDIFLPFDYPKKWVLEENRSWNEQYLVQAALTFGSAFEVVFGSAYAFYRFRDTVKAALKHPRGSVFGGGALWIRKC